MPKNALAVVKPKSDKPSDPLGPNTLKWLDENICVQAGDQKFKKWREQALAATRDTDKARATMERYRAQRERA